MSVAVHRSVLDAHAKLLAEVLGDFASFCAFLEIKLKQGGTRSFAYQNWNAEQKRFQSLRSKRKRHIVVKPRQIGFSTLELARDLWFAITRKAVNVLVVVHDAAIKKQLFSDLKRMANALEARGLLPKRKYDAVDEIVFADSGSAVRIVEAGATDRTAEGKGRSGTIHRLHATEIAFWKAAQSTWTALDAATPADAEVVIESTPNGASGLFYQMVQHNRGGTGQYLFHYFPWWQHREYRAPLVQGFNPAPRDKWEVKLRGLGCDDRQIQWWRFKIESPDWGLERTLQEFLVDPDSCFRTAGRQYFAADTIDDLFERVTAPLRTVPLAFQGKRFGELQIYENPVAGEDYIVGGDVSEGTGQDASAATVIAKRSGRTVATFHSDSIEPGDFGLAMTVIGRLYNEATLAPERNNHGHAALRAILHESGYRTGRVFRARDTKHGWLTDMVTRPIMIDDLGAAIRERSMFTPDRTVANECKSLVRNDKGKVEARGKGTKDGAKDDCWMSWCIAFQVRNQPTQELQRVSIPGY